MEISDPVDFRSTWSRQAFAPLKVAVNLSGRQMLQKDFVGTVEQVLTETGPAPDLLELEITESTLTEYARDTLEFAEPAVVG